MYNNFWKIALTTGGLGTIGAFIFWNLYSQWLELDNVFAKKLQTVEKIEQRNPNKRINALHLERENILGQLERIDHRVEKISLPTSKFKEALDYLNKRQRLLLAEKAVEYVVMETKTSVEFSPTQLKFFHKEIEQLLELVYHSLRINNHSLLNEPPKCTFASHLYVKAIDYIEQRVNSSIAMSKDNMQELKSCLRQLKRRIL